MTPGAEKLYRDIQNAQAAKSPYLYARASEHHSARGAKMRGGKRREKEQSKEYYRTAVHLWSLAIQHGAITC